MASKKANHSGNAHRTQAGKATSDTRPAYFLSLALENIRCFREKQTLELSDGQGRPARWTILLGNNGTGKTTVLQALAELDLEVPREPSQEVSFPRLSHLVNRGHSYYVRSSVADHETDNDPSERTRVASWVVETACGPLQSVPSDLEKRRYEIDFFRGGAARFSSVANYPKCYGYGAGRRLGATSLIEPGAEDPAGSLFSETAELRNAEEWLLQLDYSVSKAPEAGAKQQTRLEQVRQLLIKILLEICDIRFVVPAKVRPTPRVEFKTPYGWVPLRQLGYGYQTLIAWMVDFASRMVERYPDSPDPLAEPAVVLVDEIDLHLHPTWQRKLIGYLTERFPNTQFIATAHSPLIVQSAVGANLAVLRREGDHVVIDNDVEAIRGWRLDQIYTSDLFGLESARPLELDRPLARRKELLTKPTLSQADQRELAQLEAQIGDLPAGETAEQDKTMALLEETLDVLKKSKR